MTTVKKKLYFASDVHLGVPSYEKSLEREKLLVNWLDQIAEDAEAVYLVGDLFDFWFEYKHAIPRGFARIQGKIAELTDKGIPVHLFTGNHDMWIFDYLPKELGVQLHREPVQIKFEGKKLFIGHGDGLGPGDHGYKFLKKIFASKLCQWLFARIHPNLGIGIANYWSAKSRKSTGNQDAVFLGEDKEWLAIYCKEILQQEHFDYFVFGHRHLPLIIDLEQASTYINLGDWISYFTYGEFDGTNFHLKQYPSNTSYIPVNRKN